MFRVLYCTYARMRPSFDNDRVHGVLRSCPFPSNARTTKAKDELHLNVRQSL